MHLKLLHNIEREGHFQTLSMYSILSWYQKWIRTHCCNYYYYNGNLHVLPYTCVWQPTLAHLYQTSSLFPGPLPIVAQATTRLVPCSATVTTSNTFKVYFSFPFPSPIHVQSSVLFHWSSYLFLCQYYLLL
jgi:hypothetical protein